MNFNSGSGLAKPVAGLTQESTTTSTTQGFSLGSGDAVATIAPAVVTTSSSIAGGVQPKTTASLSGFSLSSGTTTPLAFSTPASATSVSAPPPTFSLATSTAPPATSGAQSTTISAPVTTATTTSQAQPTALTTTTLVSSSGATSTNINFVQLEETINKWSQEMEEQEKVLLNQATQVNAWDNLLTSNSEKIVELNNAVESVKVEQEQLDHELNFILAQQRELEDCLLPLERELENTPLVVDSHREHTYQLAENIDTQLKQMSEDLKEIIEHLNETVSSQDTGDPIAQIARILNAHMNSLQWIDRNTSQIQNQLDEVTRLCDVHRRENERTFRLPFNY